MRRDQLEHAIRTACQIIGHAEVIVIGSRAILGIYDETQLVWPTAADRTRAAAGELAQAALGMSVDAPDVL